ncbi:MAG: hypothetical protein BWK80_61145 [Desulfobacteraceae bacterium IS3]|nr:MAG: hypothetical protein BWK80_61145 [Desulfobacteraceae bacterium IS3]
MFQTKINNSGLIPKQISFRTMRKKNKIINGYAIFYFCTLPPSRNQRYPALPSISEPSISFWNSLMLYLS